MKHRNMVIMSGELRDVQQCVEHIDGRSTQALSATLVTDHAALGGWHRILFLQRQAIEAWVFAQHASTLWVAIDGWLRSDPLPHAVVADRVRFDVPEDVRERAITQLKQILSGASVSGSKAQVTRTHRARTTAGTNLVSLVGTLRIEDRQAATGYVETDGGNWGGRHPVQFTALAATALAADGAEVLVNGWLWSSKSGHKVYVTELHVLS